MEELLIPQLEAEARKYAASIPNFDEFEIEYAKYIHDESLPERYAPAISAADLFKRPQLPITSYVRSFIYAGSLNLIAGEPKAGKSTLVWYVINEIAYGNKFLDEATRQANVLYVTEQNEVSFRQETQGIKGFSENPNVYILLPETGMPATWAAKVEYWGDKLTQTHSNILVIDTFGSFAGLPPGGENDSACISDRLMALKGLYKTRPSLGIVLVHHIRKPSTDPKAKTKAYAELRDARGSSAIVGGVDHCLMLSKAEEGEKIRNVHVEGRFEPEEKFQLVLTDNGYVLANGRMKRNPHA